MATANPGRIGEQHEAYRKGLVLGLTMAEVGILIIFVLLLLLASGELRRAEALKRFQGKEPVGAEDLERMKAADAALRQIAAELGATAEDPPDDFTKLVRVVREAARASTAKPPLAEARSALDDIRHAREEIRRVVAAAGRDGAEAVARQAEQQSFRLANQEGQLDVLENKLIAVGQGKGARPCWVQPGGTIDYLYDVVLTSGGIRVREYAHPNRARERTLLPAPTVDPDEVLSEGVFLARTRPLFLHSQQMNCRFFVVVYDVTAAHEKQIYKHLLKTVEGHFYKRLDNGPSPF